MKCVSTYITIDEDELKILGVPEECWEDTEIVNDVIHSAIYNMGKGTEK